MDFNQISFIFNRVAYILNEVFVKYDKYKIISVHFNEVNNQLDLLVQYEIPGVCETFYKNQNISIPTELLKLKTNDKDIEAFVKEMWNTIKF